MVCYFHSVKDFHVVRFSLTSLVVMVLYDGVGFNIIFFGGWWMVAGGWWLVAGGCWLLAAGW